ncbi:MAG: ABC transporter substrate-binding protein [Burkholderiales bacterium]
MLKKLVTLFATTLVLQGSALAQETIKVGLLNMDSGPFAVVGKYIAEGAAFAIESLNAQGGALGRKYELVTQAHAGTPAAAIASYQKLVEQQGITFVTGLNISSTALALAPKVATMNALLIDSTTAADALVGKQCSQNYFRIAMSDAMIMQANREIVKKSGVKNWDILAADYAAGHDYASKFAALVKDGGGTVQNTLFAPLSTTDFGSYITQLSAKPADGLMVMFPGGGAIALAKQQAQFGLFGKFKNVITAYFTNDTLVDAQGDTTVGLFTLQDYQWQLPGAKNAAFVKAFEARYKRKPSYLDGNLYVSIELLHEAILKAKSTDLAAVRSAMAGLKYNSVGGGEVEMRAGDHQMMRPLSLVQVVKAGEGKAQMTMKEIQPVSLVTPPVSPECKM